MVDIKVSTALGGSVKVVAKRKRDLMESTYSSFRRTSWSGMKRR